MTYLICVSKAGLVAYVFPHSEQTSTPAEI